MIAIPAFADAQPGDLEDISLVERSAAIRRAPFQKDHKHSSYLFSIFREQTEDNGRRESVISTNQAPRVFLHWSDAACSRIRFWPRRLFPAYRSRTRQDAECRKPSVLRKPDRAARKSR